MSTVSVSIEIKWLIKLLKEINSPQTLLINLYENNQSTIKMVELKINLYKSEHTDIRFHLINN